MDDATKIACGLVGAALILVGGYVAYREFDRMRTVHELKQVAEQFQSNTNRAIQQVKQAQITRHRRQDAARQRDIASRTLDGTQKCVGHTVIDIHGSTYVQRLGADRRPIHCTGRLAAEPLR